MSKNNFSLNVGVNFISITYFNHGSGNQNALRPRGPTPVSHAFPAGKAVRKGCKRTVVNAVRSLWHWHFGSGKMEPQTNPFGEPSQTRCACEASACSQRLQTHGKVSSLSHAIGCYKCCLDLPLAFCAAYRAQVMRVIYYEIFYTFLKFDFSTALLI